jgi:hypothetical protein
MALANELHPYCNEIKRDAERGNRRAEQVLSMYLMHRCRFFFRDWLGKRDVRTGFHRAEPTPAAL